MKRQLLLALSLIIFSVAGTYAQEAKTVKLVETPGKFETTKEITLKPGKYQFEISNNGVDHPVAFFLQTEADKGNPDFGTALPNSGINPISDGETATTGVVSLASGTYVYSCPLNPTDHYVIKVKP